MTNIGEVGIGELATLRVLWTQDNVPVAVTTGQVRLLEPLGDVLLDWTDQTEEGTGQWVYNYVVPSTAPTNVFITVQYRSTYLGTTRTSQSSFKIVEGESGESLVGTTADIEGLIGFPVPWDCLPYKQTIRIINQIEDTDYDGVVNEDLYYDEIDDDQEAVDVKGYFQIFPVDQLAEREGLAGHENPENARMMVDRDTVIYADSTVIYPSTSDNEYVVLGMKKIRSQLEVRLKKKEGMVEI